MQGNSNTHSCFDFSNLRLLEDQYNYLCELPLEYLLNTQELFVEWNNQGMYDYCNLPFSMKECLPKEAGDYLRSNIKSHNRKNHRMLFALFAFNRTTTNSKKFGCSVTKIKAKYTGCYSWQY